MEKQKSKKPLIRFPEFNDPWKHKKLSELLSESKKRNDELNFHKDKVLSVSGEYGIVNQIEHLGRSYAGVSVHNYHVVEYGDIVYTKSPLKANPYGIIKLNRGKAGIVSTLYAVYKVNKSTAYGAFLDQYFSLDANTNRYLRPLVKKGAKNDMKISNEYVLHDKIFVPSITEQKRIASFLEAIDKKLYFLKKKKTLLEQYKIGIIQKVFSQKLRFKNHAGQLFPDWAEYSLGQLFSENLRPLDKPNGEYKAIGVRSHFKGTFLKYEDSEKNQMQTLYRVLVNDLIVNITFAWEGAVAIARKCDNDGLVSHRFPTYTANPTLINIRFFEFLYPNDRFKKELSIISPGGAGRNRVLNRSDFLRLKFNVPSIKEQEKIADFLSSINDKINSTQIQIEQTELYKKSLLQKMFC